MQEHQAEFRARGAEVVVVGQGTGEETADYCRRRDARLSCLGDPEKRVYRAFGLPRDSWWNVTGRPFLEKPALALRRIQRASLKGSLMRHSDVLQLGGVAILGGDGVVRYLYRSSSVDDLPPSSELLAELDRLKGSIPGALRPATRGGPA